MSIRRIFGGLLSVCPLIVIAALLYAAIFVKPHVSVTVVKPPSIAPGDAVYGVTVPLAGSLLWATGSDGKVWTSRDQGNAWAVTHTPANGILQDIAAWDDQCAIAVGDDGMIVRTMDGGKSWRSVDAPRSAVANKLMQVIALPDGEAWTVGEMGMVLRSTDFGATWARAVAEEDTAWNGVFATPQTVWLVGEFGRIARSGDKGKTWDKIGTSVKSSLMSVSFRDDTHGVAVGLEGVVLLTSDGGTSWQQAPRVTGEHLFDVTWDAGRKRWIAVADKGVLLSGDASGTRWTVSRMRAGDRHWHTKVVVYKDRYIAAGGSLITASAS